MLWIIASINIPILAVLVMHLYITHKIYLALKQLGTLESVGSNMKSHYIEDRKTYPVIRDKEIEAEEALRTV